MGQQAQTLARPRAGSRVAVANEQPVDRLAQTAKYLGPIAALSMVAMLYMSLIYAPVEQTQGQAYRLFYPHYGSAIITYLAYIVTAVASVGYLWKRRESWDQVARASAEVGVLMNTILLIAGSIWGKTIWGTWWAWDPRLTTTLILWFIYVGYLMLRSYGGDTPQIARSAAVLGIIGCVDIPIINQSVNWWRTLHPAPIVQRTNPALPAEMVQAMLVAMFAFFLLYLYILIQRLRVAKLEASVGQARQRLLFADELRGDGRDAG
jgi:heme exporter protein C